jgi:hypothetical protein
MFTNCTDSEGRYAFLLELEHRDSFFLSTDDIGWFIQKPVEIHDFVKHIKAEELLVQWYIIHELNYRL